MIIAGAGAAGIECGVFHDHFYLRGNAHFIYSSICRRICDDDGLRRRILNTGRTRILRLPALLLCPMR